MSFGFESYQPTYNDVTDANGPKTAGTSSADADQFNSQAQSSSAPDSWSSFSTMQGSYSPPMDSTKESSSFGRQQTNFMNGMSPGDTNVVRQGADGSAYIDQSQNQWGSQGAQHARAQDAFSSGSEDDDDSVQNGHYTQALAEHNGAGSGSLNVQFADA